VEAKMNVKQNKMRECVDTELFMANMNDSNSIESNGVSQCVLLLTVCCSSNPALLLLCFCVLLSETKHDDPQVTKMTQKLEVIATRTIEKPLLKSSTYYANISRSSNRGPDVSGKSSISDGRRVGLLDAEVVVPPTHMEVSQREEDHIVLRPGRGKVSEPSKEETCWKEEEDLKVLEIGRDEEQRGLEHERHEDCRVLMLEEQHKVLKSQKDDHIVSEPEREKGDQRELKVDADALPQQPDTDKASMSQPKRETLSERFRKWQEDESRLYSEFDLSQTSPQPQSTLTTSHNLLSPKSQTADAQTDQVLPHEESESGGLLSDTGRGQKAYIDGSEVKEGEPTLSNGRVCETLDLSDDTLQRNLILEDGRNDELDMFEDVLETSSKVSDPRDDDELSQIMERNWIDHLEERRQQEEGLRQEEGRQQDDDLQLDNTQPTSTEPVRTEGVSTEPVKTEPGESERVEHKIIISSSERIFPDLSHDALSSKPVQTVVKPPETTHIARFIHNSDVVPVTEAARLDIEIDVPEETTIRTDVLQSEEHPTDTDLADGQSLMTADSADVLDEQHSSDIDKSFDERTTGREDSSQLQFEPMTDSTDVEPGKVGRLQRMAEECFEPQYEPEFGETDRADVKPQSTKDRELQLTAEQTDVPTDSVDIPNLKQHETRPDREVCVPHEDAVKHDQMEYPELQEHTIKPENELGHDPEHVRLAAREAVEALHHEIDCTVNTRELETTDEIVVETKVTQVKTILMQLGETGNISVLETTEVKTDTDMKETKKILERDEVRSDHRQSDFVPLSPSPAGSFRSRTPDRNSPSASSVDKLAEGDLAESLVERSRGVGVDAGLYVAICPYEPETDDVMSLHDGEYLEVLDDAAQDWWIVKKCFDGREGYVPAQYLRDKQTDDRLMDDEVAKQLDRISVDNSKH